MSFSFRPAVREAVSLLIGLVGPSGGGKTYTAMRLASGIVGEGNKFAVIDTEAGRSRHYAEIFRFDVGDLTAPFRPESYLNAIKAADEAGYKAIVVDSVSHEWAGEGGILGWQEEELTRMAGDDWKKREACKMASWIKPKMAHKQMVQRLLQVQANLILCFRAEEKIAMEKDPQGKMMIVPKGWQPICEKNLPYELTVSFLLTPDKPGYPQPIKLQEQHKILFPLDKQISEDSGKGISEWAVGGVKRSLPPPNPDIQDSGFPTPEEEKVQLQEAGIIPKEEPPKENGKKLDIETFKKAILQMTDGQSLMKWFAGEKKRIAQEDMAVASKLVNDRLITLTKK